MTRPFLRNTLPRLSPRLSPTHFANTPCQHTLPTQAVEYAERTAKSGLKFHVYSDNQAGLWRLLSPSDNPGQECQIRAIKAAKSIRSKGADITLHWVPGHTKIDGNEIADQLAKSATLISPSFNQTSFAMVGVKIKQQNNLEWKQILEKNKAR